MGDGVAWPRGEEKNSTEEWWERLRLTDWEHGTPANFINFKIFFKFGYNRPKKNVMMCCFASWDLVQPRGQFQPVDLHIAETYRTGFFLTADQYIVIYSESYW